MSAQPNSRAQASGSLPDTQTQAGPSNQKNAQRIQETPEVEQRFEEIDDEFEDVVTGQNNPDEPKSPSSATVRPAPSQQAAGKPTQPPRAAVYPTEPQPAAGQQTVQQQLAEQEACVQSPQQAIRIGSLA
ncbi:hypothetical protein HBH56_243400 [Parastagonospora nodorum]|uniref:Uncharacterized protein n=1 Tax=Phaeosphaeria nodorum (strain SN15 / ATCC MYA-4574 / FGSC 10173) TaxID=321614 RepID=A0A7U2I0A7_PHANO|nr:hypothetical protein HBH56_243400 [Parastagonospora nodorum]QRC97004.1 hypothetical protein JI435_165220 [Parastagonospora nodorum SN15]KAH3924146.1 hypothetical protein HBH54_198900 [Parastagonospora nodorum]KAH3944545.1 hypothetical protein HBH53_155410 [Parastagonospora nodorum]KAH3956111.1 hypothetical protein HBH51_254400 [Parastagonospora nodorum]